MRKSIKKILFLFLFVIVAFYSFNIKADSGWDGSYDSGSSSWSSSSDSWSSSSSSWDSSDGYSNISVSFFMIGFIVFLICVMMAISSQKKNTSKKSKSLSSSFDDVEINERPELIFNDDKDIKEILPSFSQEDFMREAFRIYKDIQEAWMEFDYDALRRYTTDELYNTYYSQLTVLSAKKQKNIMKDFELISCEIVAMEHNENNLSLKVHMCVECLDYVVDKNEKVVRGSKDLVQYDYEMTFIKGLEKENKCPSCGAELDANSNKCPYCRSVIVSNSHDWVLSKKQVLSQKRK